MIPGIVLAAGASRRMGRPKALLPAEPGGTMLGRVLHTLAGAGLDPLIVVSRETLTVADAWRDSRAGGVRVVINPEPDRGQLSSLACALQALGPVPPAALVTLVDIPLVRSETVRQLLSAWRSSGAPLVRPLVDGRHGHPVIFGATLLDRLRTADPALGARPVVRAFAARAVDVAVDDAGVLQDIDTPDEYRRLVGPMPSD